MSEISSSQVFKEVCGLLDDIRNEPYLCEVRTVISTFEYKGVKRQMQILITSEEDDFIDTKDDPK